MKKLLLIAIFLFSFTIYSQRDINYNFVLSTTFTANENFGSYDEFTGETDWSVLVPRAVFLRNGFDVKLNNFVTAGVNIGLDIHPDTDVLAIPYYLDSKFTLVEADDDKLYIGGGVGKLLKIGDAFERGNYYKVGAGYYISTNKKHSFILNADFHQKRIEGFERGRLNSLSFGFGMLFL